MSINYTRRRSRGEFQDFEAQYDFVNHGSFGGCGSTGSVVKNVANSVGTMEIMIDTVTPDYHKRVARGEIIVNPMYQTTASRSIQPISYAAERTNYLPGPCPPNYVEYYYNSPTFFGAGGGVSHLPVPGISVNNLRSLAATEARGNIQAPDLDSASFIAELRQTINMFRNPIAGFTRIAKRARRAKRSDPRYIESTVLDYMSSAWLQYRYGIMPLVYTAEDAVKALKASTHRRIRHTARGDASDKGSQTETTTGVAYGNWLTDVEVRTDLNYEVRCGIIYEHSLSDINNFGTNARDIPGAVWEVVPFSFVVDWFFNTADYIAAISPTIGVKELGSWTTKMSDISTVKTVVGTSYTASPSTSVELSSPQGSQTMSNVTKTRIPGAPIGLATKVSPFGGDLGTKRLVDSMSLLKLILSSI